jgi:hypothetical protein
MTNTKTYAKIKCKIIFKKCFKIHQKGLDVLLSDRKHPYPDSKKNIATPTAPQENTIL